MQNYFGASSSGISSSVAKRGFRRKWKLYQNNQAAAAFQTD